MKKIFLILLVIASTFLLLACGRDTKDWPRISLPFEIEAINQIEIHILIMKKKKIILLQKKKLLIIFILIYLFLIRKI